MVASYSGTTTSPDWWDDGVTSTSVDYDGWTTTTPAFRVRAISYHESPAPWHPAYEIFGEDLKLWATDYFYPPVVPLKIISKYCVLVMRRWVSKIPMSRMGFKRGQRIGATVGI